MSTPILSVQHLSKRYVLGRKRADSLVQDLMLVGKRLFQGSSREEGQEVYALRDVSFELERGDILGIIGRNGAGKSTLLKILAEVTPPSDGRVEFNGTVTSILDIGTGFHPDLTGRENVFLSAALAGIDKQVIRKRFEEIHDFSGIGSYIDQPIKHYSSGMYLRLAFSVAFHTEMDILLLDEVLSVGDVDFRHRSTRRIQEIADRGTTILLVSHELPAVRSICNKCLFLHKGEVVRYGKINEVVDEYLQRFYAQVTGQYDDASDATLMEVVKECPELRFEGIAVKGQGKSAEEAIWIKDTIEVNIDFVVKQSLEGCEVVLKLSDFDRPILFDAPVFREDFAFTRREPGVYRITTRLPTHLLHTGTYFLNLAFTSPDRYLLELPFVASFYVALSPWEQGASWNRVLPNIPLRPRLEWEIEKR